MSERVKVQVGVKVLAERLGRDYKRVHEDVETLTAAVLLRRG
jgi:predicted transcriptional regulator